MQLGVLEAKTRFSELVDRAAKGEEIVITKRGVVVAKIAPARKTMTQAALDAWLEDTRKLRAQTKFSPTEQTIADKHAGHKY